MKLSEIKRDMCKVMPILEGIWTHIILAPESILWATIFHPKSGISSRMNVRTDTLPFWVDPSHCFCLSLGSCSLSPTSAWGRCSGYGSEPPSTWASAWLANSWPVESSFRFHSFSTALSSTSFSKESVLELGWGGGWREAECRAGIRFSLKGQLSTEFTQ